MADQQQIAIELSAIDNATAVLTKVQGSVEKLSGAYNMLGQALGALGIAFSAHAFVDMIEGAIGSMNALYEMSLKTGVAVETLSALRGVAKQSGTDMDQVATMTQKLSKSMYEFADTGMGKAGKAFDALGYSQAQVKAGLQNMDTFLPEFAKKLMETGTSTERVALAQEILGKAGANTLPFLHALAEAGELHGKVTAEQARQAHEFEVVMAKLSTTMNAMKNSIALDLLPSLLALAKAFEEVKKQAGADVNASGFWTAVGEGMRYVGVIALSAYNGINLMARGLGALLAAFDQLKGGNVRNAIMVLSDFSDDAQRQTDRYSQMRAAMLAIQAPGAPAASNPLPDNSTTGVAGRAGGGAGGMTFEELLAKNAMTRQKQQDKTEAESNAAAEKAQAALQAADDLLVKQADHWKDLIDPQRVYGRQMEELMKLYTDGKITVEEWNKAAAIVNANAEKAAGMTDKMGAAAQKSNDMFKDLGMTMTSSFENAITSGKSFHDVLVGLDKDIAQIILRQTVTKPMGDAISAGIQNSGISDWFKGIFGGGKASGGSVDAGTPYLVGENGPELMVPAASGTVVPNDSLVTKGGDTMNVTINVGSLDPRTAASVIMSNMPMIVAGINSAYNQRGQYGPLGR